MILKSKETSKVQQEGNKPEKTFKCKYCGQEWVSLDYRVKNGIGQFILEDDCELCKLTATIVIEQN